MRRYRYRTPVLAGPWRESRDQALEDAARAGQVRLGSRVRWMVPGKIEVDRHVASPTPLLGTQAAAFALE